MASTISLTIGNDPTPRRLRLRKANRNDVVPVPARLEDLLPQNHLARLIWDMVGRLDLSAFYAPIKVVEGEPGAPAIDPKILVALWLYAISQGVTSAREIDVLRVEHMAYIWICGGVSLNYHTLSDFRVDYGAELDELMTQVLGHLIQTGSVELDTQAQDGMRVRGQCRGRILSTAANIGEGFETGPGFGGPVRTVQRGGYGQAKGGSGTGSQRASGTPGSCIGRDAGRQSGQEGSGTGQSSGVKYGSRSTGHEDA